MAEERACAQQTLHMHVRLSEPYTPPGNPILKKKEGRMGSKAELGGPNCLCIPTL